MYSVHAARCLKYVWPFLNITHETVKCEKRRYKNETAIASNISQLCLGQAVSKEPIVLKLMKKIDRKLKSETSKKHSFMLLSAQLNI